jgi:hypothetical protein
MGLLKLNYFGSRLPLLEIMVVFGCLLLLSCALGVEDGRTGLNP